VRVRVLPRETAAAVITSAVAAMGWAVAVATVLLTVPVLVETLAGAGRLADLPLVLGLLGVVLGGVVAVALHPRRWVVLVFLAGGGVATFLYQLVLLSGANGFGPDSPYLVNRPALALVLVGIPATRALIGIAWSGLGLVVATVVGVLAAVAADVPFDPGIGAAMMFALTAIGYLTLAAIQARLRRHVPNFDELEYETWALAHGEDLSRRTTAVVHDTLLNDLAIVMNAPDRLSERARERLLGDLETLRGAEWITASANVGLPQEDAGLRNALSRLVSEYQWRGISIHVTGSALARHEITAEAVAALLGAIRAALENVAQHSGVTTAELEVISEPGAVTVMIADQGRGFDPGAVAADRLGLRASVVERMAAVGGQVRIWSAPGAGTSVVISAPTRKQPTS
jgi:hypothetical protein